MSSGAIERKFEGEIEAWLLEHGGYAKHDPHALDRELGLDPGEVFAFVEETQPDAWRALSERHGGDDVARPSFLRRLAKEIDERGTVDVLRHGVKDLGIEIRLAFFRPAHGLTPELVARFTGRSNSGGVFGADGWLYLTGHDAPELYVACVDDAAHVLRWLATRPAPIEGQGIAWDLATGTFWGVVRDAREVVSFPLAPEGPTPAVAPAPCPPGKAGKPLPPFGR